MSAENLADAPVYCAPIGGSTLRGGYLLEGEIERYTSEPLPTDPREFASVLSGRLVGAAQAGARGAVIGLPCPIDFNQIDPKVGGAVKPDSTFRELRSLHTWMSGANRRYAQVVEDGFEVYPANDTELLVAAVAEKLGRPVDPVLAVTIGTGVGGSWYFGNCIPLDPAYSREDRIVTSSVEIGQRKVPKGLAWEGETTYESALAGPAIKRYVDRTYGQDYAPEDLPADDPYWDRYGRILANMLCNQVYAFTDMRHVVVGGGVGSGTAGKYMPHLERWLPQVYDDLARYSPFMSSIGPPSVYQVPGNEADRFEMYGAGMALELQRKHKRFVGEIASRRMVELDKGTL